MIINGLNVPTFLPSKMRSSEWAFSIPWDLTFALGDREWSYGLEMLGSPDDIRRCIEELTGNLVAASSLGLLETHSLTLSDVQPEISVGGVIGVISLKQFIPLAHIGNEGLVGLWFPNLENPSHCVVVCDYDGEYGEEFRLIYDSLEAFWSHAVKYASS